MRTTEERISLWLDGELSQDEAAEMEQLCRRNPALAERVEALRSVDGLVRQAVPLQAVPAELLSRLGLSDAAPSDVVPLPAVKARWSFAGLAANDLGRMAAALAVLLGVGLTAETWVRIADQASTGADYRTLSNEANVPAASNSLMVFAPGVTAEEASAIVRSAGGRLGARTAAGAWKVQLASERQAEALARLRSHPKVLMAEPLDGGNP